MPTTLFIESFSDTNKREITNLTAAAATDDNSIIVDSTQGYEPGDILYIGELSREGCERAVVQSVPDGTTLNLTAPLQLPHSRFQPVTSVFGDKINIKRAPNVTGSRPALDQFVSIVHRSIDPDQLSTYYTDSSGDSTFWYGFTYINETSGDETNLADSEFRRGDDFGHYATLGDIRERAGFKNNYNVSDTYIDQMRRAAETEINTALSGAYSTPFVAPVPESVREFTIELAALLLKSDQYGASFAEKGLKDLRARIAAANVTDENGTSLAGGGVESYFGDDERAFEVGMKF